MVAATCTMFLLTAVLCLSIVFRESATVNAAAHGPSARDRAGLRAYYAAFVLAGLALVALLVTVFGGQTTNALAAAVPGLFALACITLAVSAGALVWSWRTR